MIRRLMSKKNCLLSLFIASFMILVPIANAETYPGGRNSAVFYAYYDSSVASYGYTAQYDAARSNWAGLSSKVAVNKSGSITSGTDKYYVGLTANVGYLGQHIPYNSSGIQTNNNSSWGYSTVAIYHNTMTNPPPPYSPLSYSEVVSNATHEIGHSLSLDHTSQSSSAISVMKQGIQAIGPQSYDINSLRSKWGTKL